MGITIKHLTNDGQVSLSAQNRVEISLCFDNYEDEDIVPMMVDWLQSDDQVTITRKCLLSDLVENMIKENTQNGGVNAKAKPGFHLLRDELSAIIARIDGLNFVAD